MSDLLQVYGMLADRWRRLAAPDREALLEDRFKTLFSYNSGRIENDGITLHDTQEIFDHARVVSFTGDLRTLFEISNLRDAWNEIVLLSSDDSSIGVSELLHLHRTLTRHTYDDRRWDRGERPGSFKRGDYVVSDDVGYPAGEVATAIEALLGDLSSAVRQNDNPERGLRLASFAHAKLVEIHPFADGNGRVARAIECSYLLKSGLPPLIVDERDRMAYYGALDAFHETGSLDEFVEFNVVETAKSWPVMLDEVEREDNPKCGEVLSYQARDALDAALRAETGGASPDQPAMGRRESVH